MQPSHSQTKETLDPNNPLGLDVYSSDGQLVGRVAGYAEEVPGDELGMERGTFDALNAQGQLTGPRRVLIDGHGYITQVEIAIPEDQMQVDFRGRRVTLPMTLSQIRELPHRDPNVESNAPMAPNAPEIVSADALAARQVEY